MPTRLFSRLFALLSLAAASAVVVGCGWDGHFNILGYTTQPLYDPDIRTVYVPMFKNTTMRQNIETDITRAVVSKINSLTTMRVVSCREDADTELIGTVVTTRKAVINVNQLNEIREAEVGIVVEVLWRDLRPGRNGDILSQPKRKDPDPLAPVDPLAALPKPLTLSPIGTFIPELGGSRTSAEQQAINRLAVQIVSMMERPW